MHIHKSVLKSVLGAGCALAVLAAASGAMAEERDFNVAASSAVEAIPEFARQAGIQIVAPADRLAGVKTPALEGRYDTRQALRMLIAGTGLEVASDDGRMVTLVQSDPQGGSAGGGAGSNAVEALIVTAQKKEEAIQDVPIAISAFSQEALDAQKIEGGFDLLKGVPNVTFSKNNFTSYNFSIRGIGTKAISATTDPGVAVSMNNTTLIVNRLFEQEYVDVERVEVLRGPQGTLFGRNATSGVINVVTAKPRLGEFEGDIEVEGGNYNAKRVRAMVNLPVGETFAVRLAGAVTQRDGYGVNLVDGSDVDDRNLWTGRVSLAWEPDPRARVSLLWEHFEEDDGRVRTSKQLCHTHGGGEVESPGFVGDFEISTFFHPVIATGAELSQGCLPGSLYDRGEPGASADPFNPDLDHGAFGATNGAAIPFVFASYFMTPSQIGTPNIDFSDPSTWNCAFNGVFPVLFILDVCQIDPYAGRGQSRDLRAIESTLEPEYRAKANIVDLTVDFDISPELTLTSQTVYNKDEVYSTQDFNRFRTFPVFTDTAAACGNQGVLFGGPCEPGTHAGGIYADFAPGGIYTDPQLGPSDTMVVQDVSQGFATQFNQEFRLASNFDAPWNFSLGFNYTRFRAEVDYYIFSNLLSYIAEAGALYNGPESDCADTGLQCVYVDPNPLDAIDGQGHNYFRSRNPYRLTSTAAFGEVYWQATPTVKITGGLRLSWDRKSFTPYPSQTLLFDYREITSFTGPYVPTGQGPEACTSNSSFFPCNLAGNAPGGKGYVADPDIVQEWREPTGRLVVDWSPDLAFTDDSMFYASFAHGYKGGGANPPGIAPPAGLFIQAARGAEAARTFDPEFVDAFELGSKNTLLDGALILNGAIFHYDYEGYQVSKIVDRAAANENFDAKIWGAELEWIFSPTRNLRFNGAIGHLQTEIAEGEQSIDLMDRTQGGHLSFAGFDEWIVVRPWISSTSNCIAPVEIVELLYQNQTPITGGLCLAGGNADFSPGNQSLPGGGHFDPLTQAPNAGAGFFADLGGKELPNAPHWTFSIGGQYTMDLPGGWEVTGRVDHYWQGESYARVYNTEYDELRAWQNTNVSLWAENPDFGVTVEVYVKNALDEMPITDTFLNSDDTGLTTNVFTLDPRLIGVSVRKTF